MAQRPPDPPALEQTTDQPAVPPKNGDSVAARTSRRPETSVRTANPVEQQAGNFQPLGDASSVTGGFTPSDMPTVRAETPSVPGYELLDELGRGGMGVVYRARQVALNRIVALKMILAGAHAREKDLERFRAEALAVARFQHVNIVQIYEVGEAGGLPYFSLEFVSGGTLSKKISRDPQQPRYSAEIVESLARAMQYAHDGGIVHRDLKPANVLLTEDGTPKITDFGLAKQLEGDSGQTQAGQVLGTPSYMAPEQALGEADRVGPAADIYALGAILYDLLTGRPPFTGTSVMDTLEMVRTREPVPPGNLAGKLPRDLETITLKCLRKEPNRRYESAGALADDLRRFLDNRPILARPVSSFEKGWRWAKRNPSVAGLGAAVAGLLIAVAIVTSVFSYQLSIKKNEAEEAARLEGIAKVKEQEERVKAEKARDEEKTAREITATQRRLALDVIRGVLIDVDGQMKNDARLALTRRRIIDKMIADLNKVRDHALSNPLEDRTEAVAYARVADIYFRTGRVKDAAVWLNKAAPILKAVADANPDDASALFNLAGITNQRADAEWRLDNGDEGRKLYAEALSIRQKRLPIIQALVKQGKSRQAIEVAALIDIAKSYSFIAFSDLRLGDPASALKNYLASERDFGALPTGWKEIPDLQREVPEVRQLRAETQVRLGDVRLRQGKLDDAEAHYRAALLDRENRKAPFEIVGSRLALGDFFLMGRKDTAAAILEYQNALRSLQALLTRYPDNLELQRFVAAVHYRLGFAADKFEGITVLVGNPGRTVLSFAHYNECLRLRTGLAAIDAADSQSQIDVMLALGRAGRAVDAAKIASRFLGNAGDDRRLLFQAACAFAIISTGNEPEAVNYREQAFRALETLIGRGWKDWVTLELDPDLESIRSNKRFSDLMLRLKPNAKLSN